jgi:hypothetical protein
MPPVYVHFKAKLFRQENMTTKDLPIYCHHGDSYGGRKNYLLEII